MHTCPECGFACTCNGDWDDIDFGESLRCDHWLSDECMHFHDDDDWIDDDIDPRVGLLNEPLE